MKSRIVKSLGCAWLLLSVAAGAVAGCGKVADEGELGGETHWLRTCSETSECGGALECLCGVCTATCNDDASCGAIVSDARCVARSEAPFAEGCGARAPARVCAGGEPGETPGTGGTGGGNGNGNGGTGGGDTPLSCGAGEVELTGECLECDAARGEIVDRLQARIDDNGWNTCETDLDCVSQVWGTPCDGQCNVSISTASVDAFEAALPAFASSVCTPATWQPECGFPRDVDCNSEPFCVGGRCQIGGVSCANRAPDRCTQDGLCATSGAFRYDPEGLCFSSELVAMGCVDDDTSCPPVTTPALDDQGRCFNFGGCLPAGFTRAPDDHPCLQALSAPACTE